jgi:hypothetical protein
VESELAMIRKLIDLLRLAKPTRQNKYLVGAAVLMRQHSLLDNEWDSYSENTILSVDTARIAADEKQPAAAMLLEHAIENAEAWLKART